jgi:hypothetical protein
MKVKRKFKRGEDLRIKLLRRTVNLKDLKRKATRLHSPTIEMTPHETSVPCAPKKNAERLKDVGSFMKQLKVCKTMASAVARTFGITRKVIKPQSKDSGVRELKGGKKAIMM